MKAVLSRVVGGPHSVVLEDIDAPEPGPGEVRIAVRACGVNYPDVLLLKDAYQFKPERPFSPGGEVSGLVDAVGDGVTAFRPGDRVMAGALWGGMAEKLVVPEAKCVALPQAMPFDEGAGFLTTYGTSYHGLKQRGALQPGESLLVLGAGGGVGLAAVELGHAMGARVIAAVSSQEKLDLALARGASSGFVYPAEVGDDRPAAKALAEQFKAACGPQGADVIYDVVGGAYAEAALRAIAWDGRFLVVGFAASPPRLPLNLVLLKGCRVIGVFYGAYSERNPDVRRSNIAELATLYARGAIRPFISRAFPMDQAGDAIARLADRKAQGKVVVTVP